MKKKILLALFTFAFAIMLSCTTAFAGTSFNTATTLTTNKSFNCSITNSGTRQYYKFTPSVTGYYDFYSNGSYDTVGTLYDSSYNQLAYNDDYDDDEANFSVYYLLIKGKTYYYSAGMYSSYNTGTFSVYFYLDYEVTPISDATVTLSKTSYTYNGSYIKPSVTVTLNGKKLYEDEDYTLTYSKNKNAGTAYVTVNGIEGYTGSIKKSFKINPKQIKSVSFNNQHYDGKTKNPAVFVNQKYYDEEYDYTYTERVKVPKSQYKMKISGKHKNVGQYTATIKFKGNYKGTVKKKFFIRPQKAPKIRAKALDTKRVKIYWSKAKQADGYEIFRYNPKKAKYTLYKRIKGTSIVLSPLKGDRYVNVDIRSYKIVKGKKIVSDFKYKSARPKLTKPKIDSIRWVSGNTYDITMKEYDSYEIEVSKNSSFSGTSYYRGYFQTSRWNLCGQCRVHYVRVRRYEYKNGRYKYGPWSKVKKIYL